MKEKRKLQGLKGSMLLGYLGLCNSGLRLSVIVPHQTVKVILGPRERLVRLTFVGVQNAGEHQSSAVYSPIPKL